MQSFTLSLPNGATLTGLKNVPVVSASAPRYRPLIIGIHGAGYSSQYFDIDAKHSAKKLSDSLEVPFVAFDRPGYKGSSPIGAVPDGSTFAEENANWLHDFILPTLWQQFGMANSCTCIVLSCHSLGTPSAIIAATLHAKETRPQYPLGGIAFSGIGSQTHPDILAFRTNQASGGPPNNMSLRDLMLPNATAEADVIEMEDGLRCHPPAGDIKVSSDVWLPRWRVDWAPHVKVCLMIGIAEADRIWMGTEEHLSDLTGGFSGSPSVDGLLLIGAPHNIEMSFWSQGWYARCYGFALSCAVSTNSRE